MHDVMHHTITEHHAGCYTRYYYRSSYLIHGVMQNVMHDTITEFHANCYARNLYWVICRMLCMTLLQMSCRLLYKILKLGVMQIIMQDTLIQCHVEYYA